MLGLVSIQFWLTLPMNIAPVCCRTMDLINRSASKFPILGYPLLDGRQQAPV